MKKDLTGNKYGVLTVIKLDSMRDKRAYWLCECDCGGEIVKRYDSLHDLKLPNCGCKTKELRADNCKKHVAGTKYWEGKIGNLHHSWKEIKSDPDNSRRNSKAYKIWRLEVFKRDGFRCQCCEQIGGTLNAHHIKHFAEYKELRFVVDNGITLCRECHLLTHNKNATDGWY